VLIKCVVVYCSVLQGVAVCCSVVQCVAVCCSVLQCVAASVAACCSAQVDIHKSQLATKCTQDNAACCSVLQRVTACCSVLQRADRYSQKSARSQMFCTLRGQKFSKVSFTVSLHST